MSVINLNYCVINNVINIIVLNIFFPQKITIIAMGFEFYLK